MSGERGEDNNRPEKWRPGKKLYESCEPFAHAAKVALQMIVGVGTVLCLIWHVGAAIGFLPPPFFATAQPLQIVATGLEYAAGVELAFMLFTDGPDEAVQPLILGLAAAALLAISTGVSADAIEPIAIVAAPVFAITIGFLLWIRDIFIAPQPDDETGGNG
jgi:hypothetical protein